VTGGGCVSFEKGVNTLVDFSILRSRKKEAQGFNIRSREVVSSEGR
jgi:hypothetical protein